MSWVPMLSKLLDEATCNSESKVGFLFFCGFDIEKWWSFTRINVRVTRHDPTCMSGFAYAQQVCFIQRISTFSSFMEQICSTIDLQGSTFRNFSHVDVGAVLDMIVIEFKKIFSYFHR